MLNKLSSTVIAGYCHTIRVENILVHCRGSRRAWRGTTGLAPAAARGVSCQGTQDTSSETQARCDLLFLFVATKY